MELGEVARDHDTGVLVTVDELHYVTLGTLEALVMGLQRAAQMRLPITIAGAGLPSLAALTGEAKSYAERMFTFPLIGSLADTQAREALVVPAEDEEIAWEEAALGRVVEVTEGYPYFHQAVEVAIEFYGENCIDCVYREGTGELPNLKTVADEAVAREAERRNAEERAAAERAQRLPERRDRRHATTAGEDAVVRELVAQLDVLDRAEPRTGPPSAEERRAERHVVETARAAPDQLSPVLVDTLLGLAADTADPTAFAALRQYRSPEAGDLLAFLRPELVAADLPDVIDRLINLTSGDAYDHWRPPAAPDGLRAAAEVDLPLVTGRIIKCLESDDEWTLRDATRTGCTRSFSPWRNTCHCWIVRPALTPTPENCSRRGSRQRRPQS